jgi:large subunit ribosomal protein L29
MKASELQEKDVAELQEELIALRREQFNLRMQKGTGQDVKPNLISKVRKNIARVKTIINQKSAGAK